MSIMRGVKQQTLHGLLRLEAGIHLALQRRAFDVHDQLVVHLTGPRDAGVGLLVNFRLVSRAKPYDSVSC